ncbi:retrovirus-related pol polyprotein from transposon TNT 1-94 [Tanacetum coccineum]|uniref:Retrovirus-related pol polyprotein from transposon TNT 1-94 n=1 Tax=Tanacetum coccineum TaxID=301880 RepID=A0ABQ5FZI8_9ASTR
MSRPMMGLRNANHTQTLDLADIYGRFVYEDNLIQRRYSDTKKALITTPSSTAISTAFFSNNVIHNFQENSDDEVDERFSEGYLRDLDIEFHERAVLANSKHFIRRRNNFSSQKANENTECYKYGKKGHFAKDCFSKMSEPSYKSPVTDEEEVSNDEEVTQVKVLIALADDELTVGKNHAHNGEWIDITTRKVNILLYMDKDADWQNYLKYINVDLKFVEEQRLNLLSKYNKTVFELNKCRDKLLVLKQAKLNAVTFQIQSTELTKLNHAFQEQLKEKKINEKWLTSSKKVSQCITEQIPHQKKKVLSGELFMESSSNMNENENIFVPASMGYDHEMVPKSKDWSLKTTETSNTPESSKDSEAESLIPLPPLKNLQGASPSLEDSLNKSVSGTVTVSETEPTIPLVPTEVNSTQKTRESNSHIQQTESSKSVDSSKLSQDSKPKVQNSCSSKSLKPKPIQKPQLKCELYHYTNHSTDDCYRILYCMICKKEDHRTSVHEMYTASLKRSENYKA